MTFEQATADMSRVEFAVFCASSALESASECADIGARGMAHAVFALAFKEWRRVHREYVREFGAEIRARRRARAR